MRVLLFIAVLNFISFSQEYDPIKDLYSSNESIIYQALEQIELGNMTEAIPIIHQVFFSGKSHILQLKMLTVLESLQDDEFEHHAKFFINSLSASEDELKARANLLLFLRGDLSGFNQGYGYFDNNPTASHYRLFMVCLQKALDTEFKFYAKTKLMDIASSSPFYQYKVFAIVILHKKYGSDIHPFLENVYLGATEEHLRLNIAASMIQEKSEITKSWIYNIIFNESSSSVRAILVDYLIDYFSQPKDLNIIAQILVIETDPIYSDYYEALIDNFKPKKFDINLKVFEIGEIIQNHIDEMIQLEWIPLDYEERFNKIYPLLDVPHEAINAIRDFIHQVEVDYSSSQIDFTGFRFLFYELTYLIEILENL